MRMNFSNCFPERWILILLFLLQGLTLGHAASLLGPELDEQRAAGFNALFNMKYDEAISHFEAMRNAAPDEPAGDLYEANAIWLKYLASLRRLQSNVYNRNNAFFDDKANDAVDPKVDAEFQEHLERGIELAEHLLDANKKSKKGLYYLGVGKNIQAGYEATVKRSFFSALRNGSKGVSLHRDLLEIDPSFTDAYLAVGMYEYVVGSLPLAVKIVVFFGGVHGSKKDGLKMLETVAEKGDYGKHEARTLLVMLYDREKRFEDSLRILDQLTVSFPENFLFRLEKASTLAQLSHLKASSDVFEELLRDEAAMKYMPDLIHYQYADTLMRGKLWNHAKEHYIAAYEAKEAPASLRTMAHLGAGKCLDALGERAAALAEYAIVMKQKKALDAQDQAGAYIKNPFTGS